MYDLIPVDCLPWIITALFVGYSGQSGVNYILDTLAPVDDRIDSSGDDPERAESDEWPAQVPPEEVDQDD